VGWWGRAIARRGELGRLWWPRGERGLLPPRVEYMWLPVPRDVDGGLVTRNRKSRGGAPSISGVYACGFAGFGRVCEAGEWRQSGAAWTHQGQWVDSNARFDFCANTSPIAGFVFYYQKPIMSKIVGNKSQNEINRCTKINENVNILRKIII
jgi:hypothetical protein